MSRTLNWPIRSIASFASLILVASSAIFAQMSLGALFVVVAGVATFQLAVLGTDFAGSAIRPAERGIFAWVAAGMLFVVPAIYAVIVLGSSIPLWAMFAIVAAAVVGTGATALIVNRLRSVVGLDTWAFAVASAQAVVIHLAAHVGEQTLNAVTPDTLLVCAGSYAGTLLGGIGLAFLGAFRVGVLLDRTIGSRWRIVIATLGAFAAIGFLVVDANFFVGRYRWFHIWLLLGGLMSLDSSIVVALAGLRDSSVLRRAGLASGVTLIAVATSFFVAPIAADPSVRTEVEGSSVGRKVLALRQPNVQTFDVKELPQLQYDKMHDFQPPENDFNILLVTIDTLRHDYVGTQAEHNEASPRMTALARESAEFTHAYAPSSHTAASMGSFLNGKYSANLNWRLWIRHKRRLYHPVKISDEKRAKIGERHRFTTVPDPPPGGNVAQRIDEAGYFTMATPYLAHAPFFRRGVGYEKGFDVYKDYRARVKKVPTSSQIVADSLAQIDAARGTPWFQWTHMFDPHEGRAQHERYSKMVRHSDRAVGELIDGLKERGVWENTVVVITSDHGEQMKEHGQSFHGLSLYDEEARVPLIIRVPGTPPRTLNEPVTNLDASATMVSLAGGQLSGLDGVNLAPFIYEGRYPEERPVFIELHRYLKKSTSPDYDVKGVVLGSRKLLWNRKTGKVELFDLETDPGEQENVAKSKPASAQELLMLLNAFINSAEEKFLLPGTETGED